MEFVDRLQSINERAISELQQVPGRGGIIPATSSGPGTGFSIVPTYKTWSKMANKVLMPEPWVCLTIDARKEAKRLKKRRFSSAVSP